MKKILIVLLAALVLAIGAIGLNQAARKAGKAYVLAREMKAAGLPIEDITIKESDFMYNEVSATGDGINLKINYYGNGLFLDNIVKNLEAEKTAAKQENRIPIYVTRLYILVVYAEPKQGMVKGFLVNKFGQVREY
jgi:hypothetical protein